MPENPSANARASLQQLLGQLGELGKTAEQVGAQLGENLSNRVDQSTRQARGDLKELGDELQRVYSINKQATDAGREYGRVVPEEARKASRAYEQVNQNLRTQENLFEKIATAARRFADTLNKHNDELVRFRQNVSEVEGQMGSLARSTGDMFRTNISDIRNLYNTTQDSILGSYNAMVHRIADSGRLTRAEVESTFAEMARQGNNMQQIFGVIGDPNRGGLGLVNSGIMSLQDVMQLSAAAMNQLGLSAEETNRMLMTTAVSAHQLNAEFGRGVLSVHQYAQMVGSLQTSLKFFGGETQFLPRVIGGFARAAEQFRRETGRGITGAAAAEIGSQWTQAAAGFGTDQRAFFGQMAGMGGGLAAGERFRLMMQRQEPGAGVASALESISRLTGGRIVSSADFERADAMGQGEALAGQMALQRQMAMQIFGGSEQQAAAMLDAMGDPQRQAALLEEMRSTKQPIERIEQVMKDSARTNQTQLQGVKERLDDQIRTMRNFAGNFKGVGSGLHLVTIAASAAAMAMSMFAGGGRILGSLGFRGGGGGGATGARGTRGGVRGYDPKTGRPIRGRGGSRYVSRGRGTVPRAAGGRGGGFRGGAGRAAGLVSAALLADHVASRFGVSPIDGLVSGDSEEQYDVLDADLAAGRISQAEANQRAAEISSDVQSRGEGVNLGLLGAVNIATFGSIAASGMKGAGGSGLGMRTLSGAYAGYQMYQGWDRVISGKEREYYSTSGPGQMAEAGLTDLSTIGLGVMSGGPIGGLIAASSVAATNLIELGRASYGLYQASSDLDESLRSSARSATNMSRRQNEAREAALRARGAPQEALDRNAEVRRVLDQYSGMLAGISEEVSGVRYGAALREFLTGQKESRSMRREYRNLSPEQQTAIREMARTFFDALEAGDAQAADPLLIPLMQATPMTSHGSQATNSFFRDLQTILGRQRDFDWDTYRRAVTESSDAHLARQEEERRREEERRQRTPVTLQADFNVDGQLMARKIIPYAVDDGLVQRGEGSRIQNARATTAG